MRAAEDYRWLRDDADACRQAISNYFHLLPQDAHAIIIAGTGLMPFDIFAFIA